MIYKVTFHISTLYIIKYHQLKNSHKKQEKLIHEFILYKKLPTHKMESTYYIMESINQDKQ